jgi:pyruvate,orthophosphate dikinase
VTHVFDLDHHHGLPFDELKSLVGGKAAGLNVMATELSLPVPPGMVITTSACNAYLAGGWPEGLDAELREHMARVEAIAGRRFGDPADPLLVSVRSGAKFSMPGMMDTVLNLGLNEATLRGLIATTGNERFGWDAYRRFISMFGRIVMDVPPRLEEGKDGSHVQHDRFEDALDAARAKHGRNADGQVAKDTDLTVDELKALVATYKEIVRETLAREFPEDPWIQLRGAIEAVFRSWNGKRARDYRKKERIPDDLGTAVTVQTMVFGNRGDDSGTGVLFTRGLNGEPTVNSDVMFNAQGEDVVAGTYQTQKLADLDARLPAVGAELRQYAQRLERHYSDMCDIEFTIEQGKLWMLQVRVGKRTPHAALRMAVDMAEDPEFPLTREQAVRRVAAHLAHPPLVWTRREDGPTPLATGQAASPGVAHGEIATSPDKAEELANAGRSVILVRTATSPDDVHGMARSAGILTTLGGLNSHAAVVARGWGIPAVVGAAGVEVRADGISAGGRSFDCGDVITIDGSTGEVFAGEVEGSCEIAPEAATLLAWARDLGIAIGEDADDAAAPAPVPVEPAASASEPTADDVVRALMVKGMVAPEGLATALSAPPEKVGPLAEGLVAAGLAETTAGAFRLTGDGKLRALALFEVDRERAGGEATCIAALDGFLMIDSRMKDTVTAWQMRDTGGEPVYNDHSDSAYDAGVLERLAAIHTDTVAWIAPLSDRLGRYEAYRLRLDRALARAQEGDPKFVASPRVDSYHSVWFELHEDLIRLSGRRRSEEVAAGRA